MRKRIAITILLTVLFSLTSCYDAQEIDDMAYITAIGIDIGVSDKWRLTLQFPTMKGGGTGGTEEGGGEGSQNEYASISVDAPSFFQGISMLDTAMPKKFSFMHAQIIAFSEELAREGFVGEYIAPIIRFREIRRTAHVFVVKGKASDFINENKIFMGSSISKSFLLLMDKNEMSGYFPHVLLQGFYESIKSTYHQPIITMAAVNNGENYKEEGPLYGDVYKTGGDYGPGEMPRKGENKIEFWGTALFDGDVMTGELNGDETRYMLIVRGEFRTGFFTFQDPEKPELIMVFNVKLTRKPKVKINVKGERPVVDLQIQIDADLSSVQSGICYELPPKSEKIEKICADIMKKNIEDVIKKCQNHNCDAFLFGKYVARSFLTIKDFEDYNWNSRFKDAKVNVDVKFIMRNTGTQMKTSSIRGADEVK